MGPRLLCCAAACLQPHLLVSLFVRCRVRPIRRATSETTSLPKLAAERGQALLPATGQLPQAHLAWQWQQVEKASSSSSNRSSGWGAFCMFVTVPRSQRTLMRTPTMIWTFDQQAAAQCTRGRTCPHALLMLPAPSPCNVISELCNAAGKMVLSRDLCFVMQSGKHRRSTSPAASWGWAAAAAWRRRRPGGQSLASA